MTKKSQGKQGLELHKIPRVVEEYVRYQELHNAANSIINDTGLENFVAKDLRAGLKEMNDYSFKAVVQLLNYETSRLIKKHTGQKQKDNEKVFDIQSLIKKSQNNPNNKGEKEDLRKLNKAIGKMFGKVPGQCVVKKDEFTEVDPNGDQILVSPLEDFFVCLRVDHRNVYTVLQEIIKAEL